MSSSIIDSLITPTNLGIILSIILALLTAFTKSETLMKLLDEGVKRLMCIPTMLHIVHMKLRQDVKVVQEIDKQDNAEALKKLQNVDMDLYDTLRCIAPGPEGSIDKDKLLAYLDDFCSLHNLIILNHTYSPQQKGEMLNIISHAYKQYTKPTPEEIPEGNTSS